MKKIAIIGGGISGLAALHFIQSRYGSQCEASLFEKEDRLGGTIGTDRIDGFVSDWGPNGFLDKVPLTLEMIGELEADNLLDPADLSADKRFIFRHGRLNEISTSPLKFMRSPLLSLGGRLRLVREPFVRARTDWKEDESIFDFATRRIGREACQVLIDPMVSGIFGGVAKELSLEACFPIMVEMEKEYGSLIKAMIARMKAARKSGAGKKAGPAGPGGRLTSFKNGLVSLIEVFENRYRERITKGCSVRQVTPTDGMHNIVFDNCPEQKFDAVISAAPAYVSADLIESCNRAIAGILNDIPYSSIAVVCLGFQRPDIGHDLKGFGFLVPRMEKKRILGSIWTSSIFSGRCPEGAVQLRTMIGGASDPEAATLSDGALLDIVTDELKPVLNITGKPSYVRIFKYSRGIPQFVIGHPRKMERLENLLRDIPGFYLTGNAYDGIGLNDCVVRSEKVVSQAAKYLKLE